MKSVSKAKAKERRKRHSWKPTGVANIYMRGAKYYYVKMTAGKREFTPLSDAIGRPVLDLPGAITAATKVAVNPFVGKSETAKDLLPEFYRHKLDSGDWEETTKKGHKHIYDTFANLMPKSLAAVTGAELQAWYDGLRENVSDSSAQTYFACIASLFRWAHQARKIPHNPAVDVVIEKPEPAAEREFANYEQRDELIAGATDDQLKLFLILGFHFGLRRKEIDHARPSWLNLQLRSLSVRKLLKPEEPLRYFRPKNGKERVIPMSKAATKFLTGYLAKLPKDAVYLLHPEKVLQGKNRYRYDMIRPFKEHLKTHGMEWLTIQGMRTTFASLLATTGKVSIEQIADWLGDTIKVTEDRYAHLLPRHDLLEKAFSHRKITRAKVPASSAAQPA